MITPISTLKRRFANFLKPTQEHFWAWMDSYWHKDENIPMNKVEGLSTALEATASAEQLRNHLTDSQAHSGLFDRKVDKEAGKTLTSNDYTNEEKRTNQANAQKRVVGLTVTGDVDKIITITFADSTVLQAPFTDNNTLPENLADIKLNSLNFNHQTGVLTGLRSDGQQLTVNLDGRYALKGHTHHWNDIEGKPSLDFIPASWNKRNNKEVIRTQVDEWLRINELNSHTNGVYFGTSIIRTDGQVQVGEGGAEVVLSNLGLTLKKRLRINAWSGGDGADIKCRGNLQIGSTSGIVEFRKIFGDLVNWNGNTTITVDINDGLIKINGIRTNVNPSGERVFTTNGQTIHLAEYIGTSGSITSNWTMGDAWYGRTINVTANATVNISTMAENRNVVFRKCFAGGAVTFNTTGKQVVYTGDNTFNGGDGSTAVVSTAGGNKMYIDIRNV